MVTTEPAIAIDNLFLRYPQGSGADALKEINLSINVGEIFGLLGPNGSGKTSLFRILASLLNPTSGSIRVFGIDLRRSPQVVRTSAGVVFQSQSLDRKLTVAENLRYQGHLYGLSGTLLARRIEQVLENFRLTSRATDIVDTLSGGMRRRLELAKALLHKPRLLLLDEPSSGLDPAARLEFSHYLETLNQQDGTTIVLTTHLMDEAERCHRLAILNEGVLVALDSPESLKSRLGGDVIVLRTADPASLSEDISRLLGHPTSAIGNTVRLESPRGHELIARLVEAFPKQIDAISLSKPSLEDVFIQQTGRAFWHSDLST